MMISAFSCMKDGNQTTPKTEPALKSGESAVAGELIYSCTCVDGPGLIYGTDDKKTLVFDHYADTLLVDSIMNEYKELLNIHSRLIYTSTGDTRCNWGLTDPCIEVPIVKIVSLTRL